jgi:hypothetical protein
MAVLPRPARGRKTIKRGPGKRIVEGRNFCLADEVRYIQRRAADHDGRIVTIGQLVLFSTETGDAWLLDPGPREGGDRLAARLARDGESEPIHIEDSDTTFAICWKGRIASRDRPSSIRIGIPAAPALSSATRPTSSLRRLDREISNIFG